MVSGGLDIKQAITDKDREMAEICRNKCPVCTTARKEQKGFKFWFVKYIEGGICPYCKSYTKVYGRKVYEPVE
jgi:hypothetical protein